MTIKKTLTLASGLTTGVLGFLPPFCKHGAHAFELFRLWPGLFLDAVLLFIIPGLLVSFGSYLYVAKGRFSGLVSLLVGGTFLTAMTLIYVFGGGIFYVFGLLGGMVVISQSLLAVLTMVLSFTTRRQ